MRNVKNQQFHRHVPGSGSHLQNHVGRPQSRLETKPQRGLGALTGPLDPLDPQCQWTGWTSFCPVEPSGGPELRAPASTAWWRLPTSSHGWKSRQEVTSESGSNQMEQRPLAARRLLTWRNQIEPN
ncbi:hypothetical protein EYF80_039807 [Liparis tanakae]|uniref:Uncharacterized protein n=1 Tax=Liparis tanakae TaxID=230148 RepID=A0A4Z2G8Y6_9TELE|nr:hypothetical protein EYF80_039807 [Liparis tanakae]